MERNKIDGELYGLDLFGHPMKPLNESKVADDFIFPPFSILDARGGLWKDRKKAWISMGIKSEIGRNAETYNTTQWLRDKNNNGDEIGGAIDTGTSIFDPVLCELAYTWFCNTGGQVVDPFAGGSVRGIVASALNRKYWGCDLSAEQIAANN